MQWAQESAVTPTSCSQECIQPQVGHVSSVHQSALPASTLAGVAREVHTCRCSCVRASWWLGHARLAAPPSSVLPGRCLGRSSAHPQTSNGPDLRVYSHRQARMSQALPGWQQHGCVEALERRSARILHQSAHREAHIKEFIAGSSVPCGASASHSPSYFCPSAVVSSPQPLRSSASQSPSYTLPSG